MLLVIGSVYLYRMHRFGVRFGRELYHCFLALPAEKPETQASS